MTRSNTMTLKLFRTIDLIRNACGITEQPASPAVLQPLEPRMLLAADPVQILALGDSITYGFGAVDQSYRAVLADMLDERGQAYDMIGGRSDGVGYDNDHYGVPGARAELSYGSGSSFVPSTKYSLDNDLVLGEDEQADVVLLHIGTNSIFNNRWASSRAAEELRLMLPSLQAYWEDGRLSDDVQIFIADIIPGGRAGSSFSDNRLLITDDYNQKIDAVLGGLDADFRERFISVDFFAIEAGSLDTFNDAQLELIDNDADPYVDWFEDFNEGDPALGSTGPNTALMLDNDFLHPTPLGYAVMAEVWLDAMDEAGVFDAPEAPPAFPDPVGNVYAADLDGGGTLNDRIIWGPGQTTVLFEVVDDAGTVRTGSGWSMGVASWDLQRSDLDGDGDTDLYWTSNGGNVLAWLMDGTRFRADFNPGPLPEPEPGDTTPPSDPEPEPEPEPEPGDPSDPLPAPVGNVYAADLDGDGRSDDRVIWGPGDLTVRFEVIRNNGSVQRGSGWAMVPSNWTLDRVDYDGDGDTDLYWTGASGNALVWLMDRTQFRVEYSPVALEAVRGEVANATDPQPEPADPGTDPDPDVDPDPESEPGTGSDPSTPPGTGGDTLPPPVGNAYAADLDGDGDADDTITWGVGDSTVRFDVLGSEGVRTGTGWSMSPSDWTLDRLDYDGDGDTDLYWTGNSGSAFVWLMDETRFSVDYAPRPLA